MRHWMIGVVWLFQCCALLKVQCLCVFGRFINLFVRFQILWHKNNWAKKRLFVSCWLIIVSCKCYSAAKFVLCMWYAYIRHAVRGGVLIHMTVTVLLCRVNYHQWYSFLDYEEICFFCKKCKKILRMLVAYVI